MFGVLLSVFKYARRHGNQINFFVCLFEMVSLGNLLNLSALFLRFNCYRCEVKSLRKQGNRDDFVREIYCRFLNSTNPCSVEDKRRTRIEIKNLRADCRNHHFPSAGVFSFSES